MKKRLSKEFEQKHRVFMTEGELFRYRICWFVTALLVLYLLSLIVKAIYG